MLGRQPRVFQGMAIVGAAVCAATLLTACAAKSEADGALAAAQRPPLRG